MFGNQGNDSIVRATAPTWCSAARATTRSSPAPATTRCGATKATTPWPAATAPTAYVFAAGSGNDQVNGFSFAEGDRLDLQGQTFTLGTSADGDVLLTLSGGGTIELNGITPAGFSPTFVL